MTTTSIGDAPSASKLITYLNPISRTLYLNSPPTQGVDVNVHKLAGILVLKKQLEGNSIDVSGLPAGCYVLKNNDDQMAWFIKK